MYVEVIPSISVGSIRLQKMLPVCYYLGHSRRCFLSLLRPSIAGKS